MSILFLKHIQEALQELWKRERHPKVFREKLNRRNVITGFNEFSIEMLINTLQMNVLLSEAEAHECKWLLQLIRKAVLTKILKLICSKKTEIKKLIRSMGANKTNKAISRTSKASDGVMKFVEAFENQVSMPKRSPSHQQMMNC